MTETKHTPLPWAVHASWRGCVVPAGHEKRSMGASIDPDREASEYAKHIVFEQGSEFPKFHRSRVMPEEAKANAHLIVQAVNTHQRLVEALKSAKETIRIWHDLRAEQVSTPKAAIQRAWEIYEKNSPEMQIINAALKAAGAL
jgi:protein-tyrosine-phosphatase